MGEEDRQKAGGRYIKLSGGVTHYQEAGPDTAHTIVLVHGFSVPYYIWDGTFDSLVHQGFRVIRYDVLAAASQTAPTQTTGPPCIASSCTTLSRLFR